MSIKRSRRNTASARALALVLLLTSLLGSASSLYSLASPGSELIPDRPSAFAFVAFTLTFIAFPAVGTLVAWMRPRHPIGWLFLVIGLGITGSTFSSEYVGRALFVGDDLPAVAFVAGLGMWSWVVAGGLAMTFVMLLFPTGRLPSPAWRPFAATAAAGLAMVTAGSAVRPGWIDGYHGRIVNPIGVDGPLGLVATALYDASFLVLCTLGAVSVGSLVVRFRRAEGVERQQLKWILYPGALFVAGIAASAIMPVEPLWMVALLALGAVPVGAGIGILRYRLFDIDVVINRTLVYAGVSTILGSAYFTVVLVMSQLLGGMTSGDQYAVAAATLAAAALFRPARSRIQAIVDRRFYRSRYDSAGIIAAFGQQMRGELDPEALGQALRDVTQRTVQPVVATVWLRAAHTEPVTLSEHSMGTPEPT